MTFVGHSILSKSTITANDLAFAVIVDLDKMECPTKVIGADPLLPYAYLPSFDLNNILSVDYDFIPGATHFLQLEQPEVCVNSMLRFLENQNLLRI